MGWDAPSVDETEVALTNITSPRNYKPVQKGLMKRRVIMMIKLIVLGLIRFIVDRWRT